MKRERDCVHTHKHAYFYVVTCLFFVPALVYLALAREGTHFLQTCVYSDLCTFCCSV
jgi:hypothetical protein